MATRTKRPMSEHARAAKAIRAKLKATYPSTKFSVTSESFAGGDAVNVSWTDGPTTNQVESLIHWHEAGTFDGMTDSYDYDNIHPNLAQAKYVQTQRGMSDDAKRDTVAYINQERGWNLRLVERPARTYGKHTYPAFLEIDPESDGPQDNGLGYKSHLINRYFHQFSLICPDGHTLKVGDAYCPECGAKVNDPENVY